MSATPGSQNGKRRLAQLGGWNGSGQGAPPGKSLLPTGRSPAQNDASNASGAPMSSVIPPSD